MSERNPLKKSLGVAFCLGRGGGATDKADSNNLKYPFGGWNVRLFRVLVFMCSLVLRLQFTRAWFEILGIVVDTHTARIAIQFEFQISCLSTKHGDDGYPHRHPRWCVVRGLPPLLRQRLCPVTFPRHMCCPNRHGQRQRAALAGSFGYDPDVVGTRSGVGHTHKLGDGSRPSLG